MCGTGFRHAISLARARSLTGPYELDPQPQILTAADDPAIELQKAGHGELVKTESGGWYLAHLASRPIGPHRRCILGRETSIQKVAWSPEGWLRLATGDTRPRLEVPTSLPAHPCPPPPERDDFEDSRLGTDWDSLRIPMEASWANLDERPGWLRLRGRELLFSLHERSLLARRLQTFRVQAETRLDFAPTRFTQAAGLICYYDTRTRYYLRVTFHEEAGRVLGIVQTDEGVYEELPETQIAINDWPSIYLRVEINQENLQFFASADAQDRMTVGPVLDASRLSDDYGTGFRFTGAFVGLCAQDLGGTRAVADFDYFQMKELQ